MSIDTLVSGYLNYTSGFGKNGQLQLQVWKTMWITYSKTLVMH